MNKKINYFGEFKVGDLIRWSSEYFRVNCYILGTQSKTLSYNDLFLVVKTDKINRTLQVISKYGFGLILVNIMDLGNCYEIVS